MFKENIPKDIFKAIINSTYNAIIVVDKRGYVIVLNKAAEKIIGIKEEEALYEHIKDIIPNTGLVSVLEDGRSEVGQKTIINNYVCVSHRSPIIYESKIWGAIGVFNDVSDLEEITKELKNYTYLVEELEAIIESSSDGIYVTDGNGYTIRVNTAYEKITGIKREEVLGKHMKELVEQGFYSQSVTLLVLQNKEPTTIIQRIKNNKDVMVTGNPVKSSSGDVKFVVTSVRDVTSLTRLQQDLQNTKALSDKYQNELKKLKPSNLIFQSFEMTSVLTYAQNIAPFPTAVLIQGESGVGKELVAEFIHQNSNRANNNFIKVNCSAIPENLLESELFGYEPGAFTGAQKKGKPGMFELADQGTILLDEIAEMPLNLQAKLLRVLQEKEVTRLGGIDPKKIDVRIISSSNKHLEELILKGQFREDLFYRLNVITINIPPLRERTDDISYLADYFLDTYNKNYQLNKRFDPKIKMYFRNHSWPGNVRELKNLVENLVVSTPEDVISEMNLPKKMISSDLYPYQDNEEIIPLDEAVKNVEIRCIKRALQQTKSLREASKLLQTSHTTLSRKIKRYGLEHLEQK